MRTLPTIINKAMPGYFPDDCTPRQYAEIHSERPALRAAIKRVSDALSSAANHPSGAKVREAIKQHGYVEIFHRAVEDYLHQDLEGFIAREAGLSIYPDFIGGVYAEFCDWKEMNAKIAYLDFEPAN